MRFLVLAALAALTLAGTGSAQSSKLARTPDGHPDLQGTWTNATLTPMQRPAAFAQIVHLPGRIVPCADRAFEMCCGCHEGEMPE